MSDIDKELDAMLTESDEDKAAVEEPETGEDTEVEGQTETDATLTESAGRQPDVDSKAGDAQSKDQDQETEASGKQADSVPLRTLIDRRRRDREQMRAMHEQMLAQNQEIARLRSHIEGKGSKSEDDEDDDEPLTRADLRRIERERAERQATETQASQAQRVERALIVASQEQRQLLAVGEPYLSPRDRGRIAESDKPLETALELCAARVDAFGSDNEIALLDRLFPPQPKKPASPSVPPGKPNGGVKVPKKAAPADVSPEHRTEEETELDASPNVRGVLEHMFRS